MLVSRFFKVYNLWRWPNPVTLCPIQDGSLGLPVWDPRRNFRDRQHPMPTITPAYPCMNSSHNVSTSTLRVMMEEFQRGNEICEVMSRKAVTPRCDSQACFGFFCYVGLTCIQVGSLENYASRLIMLVIYTCRLEKPFDQDVICILYFIIFVFKL
ncbi:hypothetical protein HYC85_015275 [Camellia sinensis]|uniref:polynucleotide adenylyltransferase n=1 Tax=Camellia sinensis TaxID=4442 RepID=A0A7J7GX73_CAMSI|nr:hypothetical protein HYC85_015275 [Camellia sinensis]